MRLGIGDRERDRIADELPHLLELTPEELSVNIDYMLEKLNKEK